jgi:antitoxin VapB
MATMNIKDPAIHAAARRLARARGISMTEAVRQAIDEALAKEVVVRDEAWVDRVLELGRQTRAKADALGIRPLTDDEIYDERGLPR